MARHSELRDIISEKRGNCREFRRLESVGEAGGAGRGGGAAGRGVVGSVLGVSQPGEAPSGCRPDNTK